MLKLDLHVHMYESTDFAPLTVDIVERLIETVTRKGLDGIAVADHEGYDPDYPFMVRDIVEQHFNSAILIIPACEREMGLNHEVELYLSKDKMFRFLAHRRRQRRRFRCFFFCWACSAALARALSSLVLGITRSSQEPLGSTQDLYSPVLVFFLRSATMIRSPGRRTRGTSRIPPRQGTGSARVDGTAPPCSPGPRGRRIRRPRQSRSA